MRPRLNKLPPGVPVTEEAAEKALLNRLNQDVLTDDEYLLTLWQLACFYNRIPRADLAEFIIAMMTNPSGGDSNELSCLCLGQLAEQRQDYDAAVEHYTKGLELKPVNKDVSYSLHNNLASCMSVRGDYSEAERHCRLAIEMDSYHANAFKNLGISLAGQNDLVSAAWAYIEATKVDARDPRAFHLLEKLVAEHPEIIIPFPGVLNDLEDCREAVETVLQGTEMTAARERAPILTYDICYLKFTPGKGFTRSIDDVERDISAEEIQRFYTEEALKMLNEHPNTWCVIAGEDKKKTSEENERGTNPMPTFQSRSEYLKRERSLMPCLLLRGTLLERAKAH